MDSDENPEVGTDHDVQAEDEDLARVSRACPGWHRTGFPLETMLTQVATYAVQAIPGADGAGLTLLEQDRADTIVSTAPFVTEIDDIQYEMGQVPYQCRQGGSDRPVGLARWRFALAALRWPGRAARRTQRGVVAVDHARWRGRCDERLRPRQERLRRPGRGAGPDLRCASRDRRAERARSRTDPAAG